MPPATTIPTSPSRRNGPSSIADIIVQRSPILSPKIVDSKQQRSGSVRPPSPPQRLSTPPQPSPDKKPENGSQESEIIDMETFNQILELDDDDGSYEFSKGMALDYFDQAETTFEEMEAAVDSGDCKKLSSLGHFLKGSSATLGVKKVRDSCELIQHYGALRDEEAKTNLTPDVALTKISTALKEAKEGYKEAETWLRAWYANAEAGGRITEEGKKD